MPACRATDTVPSASSISSLTVATLRLAEGCDADSVTKRSPVSVAATNAPLSDTRRPTRISASGAGLAAIVNSASAPSVTPGPALTETAGSATEGIVIDNLEAHGAGAAGAAAKPRAGSGIEHRQRDGHGFAVAFIKSVRHGGQGEHGRARRAGAARESDDAARCPARRMRCPQAPAMAPTACSRCPTRRCRLAQASRRAPRRLAARGLGQR